MDKHGVLLEDYTSKLNIGKYKKGRSIKVSVIKDMDDYYGVYRYAGMDLIPKNIVKLRSNIPVSTIRENKPKPNLDKNELIKPMDLFELGDELKHIGQLLETIRNLSRENSTDFTLEPYDNDVTLIKHLLHAKISKMYDENNK